MKAVESGVARRGRALWVAGGMLVLLLGGCVHDPGGTPSAPLKDPAVVSAQTYYLTLQRMTAQEIGRERLVLAALPATANNQVRMAMVLGHPKSAQDYGRALALLDAVLKSQEPAAQGLHPLARLLADNYQERQRLEGALDRQGGQLKESQRKAAELQEKIDHLADIERSLTQRPRSSRSQPTGSAR